jgi:hypothetical protein
VLPVVALEVLPSDELVRLVSMDVVQSDTE